MRDSTGWESLLEHIPQMELSVADDAQGLGLRLPALVINLTHRTDRWQKICQRMGDAGLTNLTRAPAVEGAKLTSAQFEALLGVRASHIDEVPNSHLALTRPAVGCFLSHAAIWRWVIASKHPRVLVLEDDAAPSPQFSPEGFRNMVTSLTPEQGLVFPGQIIMDGLAERHGTSNLARLFYFNGTFSYLITPAACQFLLQHVLPPMFHIDHQISRVLIEQRATFPAYHTNPQFFEPDWSLRSDCYVPLSDDSSADRELQRLFGDSRDMLLKEGRALLSAA